MCSHILFAMSFKVQTTYYAMVEDEFTTCLDTLTQRLVRVEANLRKKKKSYGNIVNRVLNSNGGSGKRVQRTLSVRPSQESSRKSLLQEAMVQN